MDYPTLKFRIEHTEKLENEDRIADKMQDGIDAVATGKHDSRFPKGQRRSNLELGFVGVFLPS